MITDSVEELGSRLSDAVYVVVTVFTACDGGFYFCHFGNVTPHFSFFVCEFARAQTTQKTREKVRSIDLVNFARLPIVFSPKRVPIISAAKPMS